MKCPKCHADNPDTSRFCANCAAPLGDVGGPGLSATRTLGRSVPAASLGAIVAGKYRIIEEIGRGGMGVVYKAEDIKLNRLAALKFLPPQWASDPEARERFIHEARAASALDHPNICVIHEIGETDDRRMFIAMACYEGESLREKIRRGVLKPDEAIAIAVQVAQGMAKAHQKGIVHRDIKPANILITSDGVAKIVDFGLAKLAGQVRLTKEGSTVGTVAYMSPEQVKGEAVDQRTDIWSVGVVLYEIIAGRLPFKGDLEQSLVHSILTSDPEPASKIRKDLPKGLEPVIFKSLMKNPSARYQSMDELAEDLKAVAEGLKPLKAKLGLFQGRMFGIKKAYAYAGLACLVILAGILLLIKPSTQGKIYDSIAVLPLENLSQEPGQDAYSLGLAEELITRLWMVGSLRVAPLSAVRDYRTSKKTYKDIRREIDANVILDPAFIRVGNRVRITAKLVDTETERLIWANSYNRDAEDILAMQAEISQAIVREIQAKLTPEEKAKLTSSSRVNPAAFEAYLRGKQLQFSDAGSLTAEELSRLILKHFQDAIDIDPNFAPAYFALVLYYNGIHASSLMPYEQAIEKAEAALKRGLELDSNSSEAQFSLAVVSFLKWDWEKAREASKRAVELGPGNPMAYALHADLFRMQGRFDEAISVARKMVAVNITQYYGFRQGLAFTLIDAKEYDEAIGILLDILKRQPDLPDAHNALAFAYAYKGMSAEAIAEAEKSLALLPKTEKSLLDINNAIVYALANRREDALRILDDYLAYKKENPVDSYNVSDIFAALGDKEEAFKWLERAIQEHAYWVMWLKIDMCMENLRSDPRYGEYLKRAGFEK